MLLCSREQQGAFFQPTPICYSRVGENPFFSANQEIQINTVDHKIHECLMLSKAIKFSRLEELVVVPRHGCSVPVVTDWV